MRRTLGHAANRLLSRLDLQLAHRTHLSAQSRELEFLRQRSAWHEQLAPHAGLVETFPRGQLGQDLFALNASGFRRGGFFVEIGAAGGVDLSNTYLLERSFGWDGILVEPARSWHESLSQHRRCAIDHRCVWPSSGEHVEFAEAPEGEYSTVVTYADQDMHAPRRAGAQTYRVETIALQDLLKEHSAPSKIDYLSIDTEGSEFEIIRDFDLGSWRFGAITIEHNYDEQRRTRITELLTAAGYQRAHDGLTAFDDWYLPIEPI